MLKLPDISKWSTRERFLALSCVTIVAIVLIFRVVVSPWMDRMEKLRKEMRDMGSSMASQLQLLSRKPAILSDVERYQEYLRSVGPNKELHIATLLKEIEDFAREAQVNLEEVKPLPEEETDSYHSYSFEIRSLSSLDQWVRFVHAIESSRSLFEVERAKVEAPEDNPELLESTLHIVTIVVREPIKP